jgi:hypothetical protein
MAKKKYDFTSSAESQQTRTGFKVDRRDVIRESVKDRAIINKNEQQR